MIRKLIFTALVILVAFSCSHDTFVVEQNDHPKLLIKTGTVCGWCTVNDTLTIKGNTVRYVNYINCSNSNPTTQKTGQLHTSELDSLISKLNFEELKKLNLNSGNIAFDGCDDWIFCQNGSETHYIRFTRNDTKLQPIKAFVGQLNAIKAQYAGN